MTVVVLDIGTTGTKSFIFDDKGVVIAKAYKEYPKTVQPPDFPSAQDDASDESECST